MREQINKLIELKNMSGKNAKKKFLKDNKDDTLFIDILRYLLNDFILTGIGKKSLNKEIDFQNCNVFNSFYDYLDYIKDNNTGRDFDIMVIQESIKYMVRQGIMLQNQVDVFKELVTKNLKLGITAKSFNKVFPNNKIKTFNVMLAKKYRDHWQKVSGFFTITKKLDGIRCAIIKEDGDVKAYTRSGKPIDRLGHILTEIKNLSIDNLFFDGELLNDNDEISTGQNFRETTSTALSSSSDKTNLRFHCFDMVKLDEFYDGKSNMNHKDRLELVEIFMSGLVNCKPIKVLYQGTNTDEIDFWSDQAEERGWEGIMVSLNKPYVCKRTDSLLKVKQMKTIDLRVIDFEEGSGKNSGTLGAIVVEYKGNRVGVGSGFSDKMRDVVWNNKDDYLNVIAELRHFGESKNKEGKKSLRHPVFKIFRFDKDEESYN